jgi:hypothetical protein
MALSRTVLPVVVLACLSAGLTPAAAQTGSHLAHLVVAGAVVQPDHKPRWYERSSAQSPQAASWAAAAFDSARGEVLLFGGWFDSFGFTDETWAWNGTTWTRIEPDIKPRARGQAAMAYDPVREEIVLFGGIACCYAELNDTWVFADGQWVQRHPSTSPAVRWGQKMGYDPHSQRIIMYGGGDDPAAPRDETWAWDGDNWTELHPTATPSERWGFGLAYDDVRSSLVLFGGIDAQRGRAYADTWSWDGETWRKEILVRAPPPARSGHGMSSFANRIMIFGGATYEGVLLGDTWILRDDRWRQRGQERSPSARAGASVAWDPVRRSTVQFGGAGGSDWGSVLDDTWEFTRHRPARDAPVS